MRSPARHRGWLERAAVKCRLVLRWLRRLTLVGLVIGVLLLWQRRHREVSEPVLDLTDHRTSPGTSTGAGTGTGARYLAAAEVRSGASAGAPAGYPVKVKLSSGIYHEPGTFNYERTRPDRWYRSPAEAAADGFRAPKR